MGDFWYMPFRRVVGIKARARVAGASKILQPEEVFDRLPFNEGGVLTAFRCYIDPTDDVTQVVTLHATELVDGANLNGPNDSFSGAAAAEFLLASSPSSDSVTPVAHDGQTIATSKILGAQWVPFERGLHLFAEVVQDPAATVGGTMYIRCVVEGFTFHRACCKACARGQK